MRPAAQRRGLLSPETLWILSIKQHRQGRVGVARLLKSMIFLLYHAVLPYECEVAEDVSLLHRGLGTVVHPNTTIGSGVSIGHGVTLAAGSNDPDSKARVVLEDGVIVGSNAAVVGRWRQEIRLGAGCVVGVGAVVTRSADPGAVLVSPAARPIERDGV